MNTVNGDMSLEASAVMLRKDPVMLLNEHCQRNQLKVRKLQYYTVSKFALYLEEPQYEGPRNSQEHPRIPKDSKGSWEFLRKLEIPQIY